MSLNRRSFLTRLAGLAATAPFVANQALARNEPALLRALKDLAPNDERFWRIVRESFPLTRDRIYTNNGGLGPMPYPVLSALEKVSREVANRGETYHHHFEEGREHVARFLGADPAEVAFTRNATEGMNIIARGIPLKAGDEVVMSYHEHPGGSECWLVLMKQIGVKIRLVEWAKTAEENLDRVKRAASQRTRVVSLSHVTCTTGLRLPAREIADFCRARDIISVFDGAQSAGMIPVNLHEIGCDFFATSGHKWMLGPIGSGIVYISKRMLDGPFQPSFVGAYSNDETFDLDNLKIGFRKEAAVSEYGTRDPAIPMAMQASVGLFEQIGPAAAFGRGAGLAHSLKQALATVRGVDILTPMDPANSGNIVAIRIAGVKGNDITAALGKDFSIRARPVGEHRLDACRFSFHIYNSPEEVTRIAEAVERIASSS